MSTSESNKSRASSAGKSGSTKRSGGKSASGSSTKKTNQGKKKQPVPMRREIGALVCFLLAVFAALGYFGQFEWAQGAFISFFSNLLKGLFGYGFWIAPPAFLIAGGILMFHRGRPVRRRTISALILPLMVGGLVHVILLSGGVYPLDFKQIPVLWADGLALKSGGVISGGIAFLFSRFFSRIGAAVIFLLVLFFCNMSITKITPVDIWDGVKSACGAVREYFRSRPEYEEEEETPAREKRRFGKKKSTEPEVEEEPFVEDIEEDYIGRRPPASRSRKRAAIDIPLDEEDPFGAAKRGEKPERYFDNKPGVRPPHEFLEREAETKGKGTPPAAEEAPAADPLEGIVIKFPEAPAEKQKEDAPAAPAAEGQKPAPARKPRAAAVKAPEETAAPDKPKKPDAASAAAKARTGVDVETYQYPPVYLLETGSGVSNSAAADELAKTQELLDDTIQSFGIDARIINVTRGPSVTRYELELMRGVKLNKLTNLAGDIALSLGASSVRISPITGRNSVVGIEVPNQLVTSVPIREVIDSREFRTHTSKVAFAVGKDISGKNIVGNIAKLPHMLIAGTTGSGKSVCTNSLIISLLYKASPEDVRLIMVDPKMVELGIYNGIPHLLIPVVTDPKKAAGALQWAVTEMMKRYRLFSEVGVRDLASYNALMLQRGEEKLPQIVVVIDELADLMLVAAKEVEESICRVAQMGRASGMHLVIATQRPSADVITGLMKANIPSRIAFAVASSLESRIILDNTGAEKLVGKGDMLYAPLGIGKPLRVQGCIITDEEVAKVVEFIKQNSTANYDDAVMQEVESNAENTGKKGKGSEAPASGGNQPSSEGSADEADELLPAAIEVVVETGMASVSMLQRRLKLGYSRAARLVDQMEERKIVGPFEGSKPRQVLITKEEWNQIKLNHTGSDELPAMEIGEDEYAAALAMSEAADATVEEVPDYIEEEDFDGEAPF